VRGRGHGARRARRGAKDLAKIRRWDAYPVAFGLEHEAVGHLALFVPQPGIRAWIRARVLPRMQTRPLLIEPDQIERITDPDDAHARPELTILGCLYHVHEPAPLEKRVEVFRAAWRVIQGLAERVSLRYAVLVMSLTPPAVFERGIAELREAGELDEDRYDDVVSDSERLGWLFHRGMEAGHRRSLRRFIFDLLELRGLAVTPAQRERIESCESLETLERWYAAVKAAAANQSVEELLS
jgi:hypothetical protein